MPVADIPAGLWSGLDPALPVSLLPVRLEFRYGTRPGDGGDVPVLRLRIYPDDVSVVTSDPGLSAAELDAGLSFWRDHEAPQSPDEPDPAALSHRKHAVWEVLTRRVGVARAPFVARSSRGGNPAAAALPAQRQPATAHLLPDAWVVSGRLGGRRVVSTLIPVPSDSLQVGPTPGAQSFDPSDPHLVGGEDALRWAVDFDAAVARGMGATIDIPTEVAQAGLDTLHVVGVRQPGPDRTPEQEAGALADLITAHDAAGKVAFVPQGTPTNNLADRASGWSSEPDVFAAYEQAVAPAAAPVVPPAGTLRGDADNAAALAMALGMPGESLAGLEGGDDFGQRYARAMGRALFPVTLGEILGTLLHPVKAEGSVNEALLDRLDDVLAFATDHVTGYVRARGPLPVLRVGAQPYGMLPITLLDRWSRHAAEPAMLSDLVGLLGRLRAFWEQAARTVPALAAGVGGMEAAATSLAAILGQGPLPHPGAYGLRTATGQVATLVYSATGPKIDWNSVDPGAALNVLAIQDTIAADARILGYRAMVASVPGSVHGSLLEAMKLQGLKAMLTWVAHTDPARGGLASPADYLRFLLDTPLNLRLLREPIIDLLYQLAERALVLAGEADAFRILRSVAPAAGVAFATTSPEIRATDLSAALAVRAPFSQPVGEIAGGQLGAVVLPEAIASRPVGAIVEEGLIDDSVKLMLGIPHHHANGFPGTRAALAELAGGRLSDDEYTQLVGEALACCTNRLDAWYTSVATRRLDTLRGARPAGVQIGCWGLLVDVRPTSETPAPASPPGWEGTPQAGAARTRPLLPARQVGYEHAPSLAQARTAGILRSGELSHMGDGSSLASIDLTSRRSRIARDVLEAVRNGQPIGAVLGYQVERGLGEAGLHTAIETLRAAFPQRRMQGAPGQVVDPSDAVVPAEIMDGLDAWTSRATVPGMLGGANPALQRVLDDLNVAVEAIADLLVAEGVHHLASGRTEVAGATFEAIAHGSHPPLDLDVLPSPQAGVTITNRVILALGQDGATAGWNRAAPRAVLAPEVELWVEGLLGDASRWKGVVGPATVSLGDLGICALDAVCESAGDKPLLARRFAAAAGQPPDASVATPPGDTLGWGRLVALCQAIAAVVRGARPAGPDDVAPPSQETNRDVVVVAAPPVPAAGLLSPLAARIAKLVDDLDAAIAAVGAAVPDGTDPASPVDPAMLVVFASLGLPGSIGAAATAGGALAAASAARAILADVDHALAGVPAAGPGAGRAAQLAGLAERPAALEALTALARRVAGDAVVVVPEVPSALGANLVPGIGTGELESWLSGAGRVRDAIAAYDDVRLFAEALGGAVETLSAAQLPLKAGEGWLGGELSPAGGANALRPWTVPDGPRDLVVIAGPAAGAQQPALRGLVIDAWSEVIPAPSVTTGLAVHYDAPGARPPQTVLLAVHPDPNGVWGWELLDDMLTEALQLARIRLVELDDLDATALDEYLPLTYVRDGVQDLPAFVMELTRAQTWIQAAIEANRVVP